MRLTVSLQSPVGARKRLAALLAFAQMEEEAMFMPSFPTSPQPQASKVTPPGVVTKIRELEHQVQRLQLMNQAFWELARERLGLTDEDIERVCQEVDLRDGVQDGRMTETALRCPTCGRVSSSKHWKCLYCGQQFQKPVMG
jgi:hypothetical protein